MAEAEWLAGWIALRLLQEPATALKHFSTLQQNVSYPISQARAAYWLGRTETKLGDTDKAHYWYGQAAQQSTTFYAKLAAHELDTRPTLTQTRRPSGREKMVE